MLVSELDDEHVKCAKALSFLASTRSATAIAEVLEAYTEHFSHEEQLLDQHLYHDVPAQIQGFSAKADQRKTHFADHARMLRDLRSLATRHPEGLVPTVLVDRVLRDFERHAADYDDTYSEPLSQALALSESA